VIFHVLRNSRVFFSESRSSTLSIRIRLSILLDRADNILAGTHFHDCVYTHEGHFLDRFLPSHGGADVMDQQVFCIVRPVNHRRIDV